MNPKAKKFFRFIVFLSLSGVLLFFAFKNVDLRFILRGFLEANFFWVILSLCVSVMAHAVRALRWQLLIEPLGKRPKFSNTLGAVMIGYFANLAFPRIGEITRCGVLNRQENLPFGALIGTVIVERVSDLLMLVTITLLAIVIKIDLFGTFIITKLLTPIKLKIQALSDLNLLIGLGVGIAIILLIYLTTTQLLGKGAKERVQTVFSGLANGLRAIARMNQKGLFIGYSILLWFCYWLMTYLLVFSIPATSSLGAADALFLLVVGSVGMLVPVQGGFGAFHIATAMGLGVYGISREEGLVFATISHEAQTLLVIVLGLLFVLLFMQKAPIKKRVNQKQNARGLF
ncbi:MAG: flippase-like domain-containing protein [Bacteroidales bacterium]|nr:flippase-like domain-containing protein [Bacteroidales bacterium]MBN2750923.1 flippase-like domain-containing protein [Bacteroidales bacterium]